MDRRYAKLVYEKWNDRLDIQEAIRAQDYSKSYLLADGTVGRVDVFDPEIGLFKVSYRLVSPPYEAIVEEHFLAYPNVLCEVCSCPTETEHGLLLKHVFLFQSAKELKSRYEVYLDRDGRVMKRVMIDERGERLNEEQEAYDAKGQWLSTTGFDASGELIREYHRDDD